MIELNIQNGANIYNAADCCEGEITLETVRVGKASKLSFKVVKDSVLDFQEGNTVTLAVDGVGLFFGYVFSKERTEEQIISVTAYDQLVYLAKNKDTYVYKDKSVGDIVKMIADDYKLKTGEIADTAYRIPSKIEDGQTLLDIIYNAIAETLMHSGEYYCLYDDMGRLTLQELRSLQRPYILSSAADMHGYSYKSSIEESYNRVKFVKDNEETGRRDTYIAQDSANMARWGILQHYEKLDNNINDAQAKARLLQTILNKNKPVRTLSVKNAGNINLRAGNSLYVDIPEIGEISVGQWLIIDKCVHSFSNSEHSMQLDFRGDIR